MMPFTWSELLSGAGVVISVGAAFLLVKLLISNTLQQEKFFNALGKCYTELESSSDRLDTLCTILDRRFSNFEENKKQSDPFLINSIQRFDKAAQEIRDRLDDLLLSEESDIRIAERLSEPVLQELNKLQTHLEQMAGQLRRNNYLSADENAEMAAMRKRIESYQSMMMKARSEAKETENVMAELRQEIQQLRVMNNRPIQPANDATARELQTQLDEMEQQKRKLEEQLAALNNEKERNEIEKKFIEDRFMELS
jgi:chromosome segregation ATPase